MNKTTNTLVYADAKTQNSFGSIRPEVGQTVKMRGLHCLVIAVRDFGTIDIEAPNGKCFRLSGLGF